MGRILDGFEVNNKITMKFWGSRQYFMQFYSTFSYNASIAMVSRYVLRD